MPSWNERQLEDFLVDGNHRLFRVLTPYVSREYPPYTQLLGRQVPCENGVIDLLFCTWLDQHPRPVYTIWVTELKAARAGVKAVEQVMRYAQAIESVNLYLHMPHAEFEAYGHYLYDFIKVEPLIIAPSFDPSIRYFPNRICVTEGEYGFEFAFDRKRGRTHNDNRRLNELLEPIALMATESARSHWLQTRLQEGVTTLDNLSWQGNN